MLEHDSTFHQILFARLDVFGFCYSSWLAFVQAIPLNAKKRKT